MKLMEAMKGMKESPTSRNDLSGLTLTWRARLRRAAV